jgi:hypothetical protein
MRFLTCDHVIDNALITSKTYLTEADRFYESPLDFVYSQYFDPSLNVLPPRLLIMYESMWTILSDFLIVNNYVLCKRLFNSHFPMGDRQDVYMVVACLRR